MAGLHASISTGPVALVGATTQTVLQIQAPANQRLRVVGYELSFDGVNSANTPCRVVIERQTSGSFSTTLTAQKRNDPSGSLETLQAVGRTGQTVAPTSGNVLHDWTFPVFGGFGVLPMNPGQEDMIPGGTILGVKLTAPQAVNAQLTVLYEE